MSKGRRLRGGGRRQRGVESHVGRDLGTAKAIGYVSALEDDGDDCPVCLFIRERAHRATGPGRMIALSAAEVAELRGLMGR